MMKEVSYRLTPWPLIHLLGKGGSEMGRLSQS